MKILIVEDDRRMSDALSAYLRHAGYQTECAPDGESGLAALGSDTEAVLLDLGLPDMDGLDVCRQIRSLSGVPIIVATARSDVEERIKCLQAGADDYLVKPYDVRELVARIEAVGRRLRTQPSDDATQGLTVGDITIDFANRVVTAAGTPVDLTPKEFDIIAVLARYPGVVVPRERLIREVWGTDWSGFSRSLEVHVGSIRRKLHDASLVATIRGIGYRLRGA